LAINQAVESMTPIWSPGSANGYHAASYGWILDELVYRWEGKTTGQVLAAELTGSLGIKDLYLGLPDAEFPRMAKMVIIDPVPEARALTSDAVNAFAVRLSLSWVAGVATATALAGLMNLLVDRGTRGGRAYFSEDTFSLASRATNSPNETDRRLMRPIRWGLGFILGDTPDIYGTAPHAGVVGHAGGGASVAWADPEKRLAVAFLCNGMLTGGREWERYRRIGDVIYGFLRN